LSEIAIVGIIFAMRRRLKIGAGMMLSALVVWAIVARPVEFAPEDHTVQVVTAAGSATGVVCQRGGSTYVWTVAHVAKTAEDESLRIVKVYRSDGHTLSRVVATAKIVACGDPARDDVALLKVSDGRIGGNFVFAETDAAMGDALVHCGVVQTNRDPIRSWGKTVEVDRPFPPKGSFDLTTAISLPGASGGGLYNSSGQCVGLRCGGVEGKPLARYIPLRQIRAWAQRHNVGHAL
jgi:hypothetical protein